jgi:hypothetical protein
MARGRELGDRVRATARPWEVVVYLWIPLMAIAYSYYFEFHSKRSLEDFRIFRHASKLVLHGHSPFPQPTVHAVEHFNQFVYPPAAALFFAPLAEIPMFSARVIMLILGVVCVLLALWLLDVRDWRCYGLSVMSGPAVNSLALGAVTSFLLLGAAAAWRYRARVNVSASAAALTAVFKVLLWPLGVWYLATRRLRAAAVFVAVAVVVTLGSWALIGFAGLRTYPKLLHALAQAEQLQSYSVVALLRLSGSAATAVSLALIVLVVLGVALAARGADGDRRSFAVAVVGAILATPIVWQHYFLLLLVPLALYRPRMSWLWFLPVIMWATPSTHSHGTTWKIVFALAITAVISLGTIGEAWGERLVRRPRRAVTLPGRGVARADA